MKTMLTVEVEYNPAMTDGEGLACAMDRLFETALSTPDILSEYGNPTVGEFFVAKETASSKIVLNISGGVLQDVFSSDPAISVALVNWTPKVPKNIHEERSIMGMHVVLVGNPVDGFKVYGPFKTYDDAAAWTDDPIHSHMETWIVPLHGKDEL